MNAVKQPLEWRVWLSGASSGIGQALARAFVERGCRIALFARRQTELEALRQELCEASASEDSVLVQVGDVGQRDEVHAAVREAEETFGAIDVLLLNAGIGDPLSPNAFDAALVERIHRVNFLGAVYGIEAALPDMLRRAAGTIAAVSSIGAVRGMPTAAPYCASKAALTTFLESLRLDLHGSGVRVTTISPGFVRTPLTDRNRFPMPFLMEPEAAANRILSGLVKRRREIHFPRRLTVPLKLFRCLPGALSDALLRRTAVGKGYGKRPSAEAGD